MVGEQDHESGAYNLDQQNLDSIPSLSTQVPWKVIISGLTVGTVFASAPIAVLYLLSLLSDPSRLVPYLDSKNGIEIQRPLDWEVRKINNNFIGDIVQFISPKAQGDSFRSCVTISVEKFPGTFKQYTQSEIQDIRLHLKSASMTINQNSTLALYRALELEYTAKEGNKTTKYWKKSTLYNKQVYKITYAANVADYKKYFPTVERMAQSFEIKSIFKAPSLSLLD
ncbi:serine/threonine protein kinase [Calothrix sp. NIES-4071]|nr:serine/threonine protein kinase [Calothrix sp. NIES-4071]BAZ62514.1 serine/threonine protein kinase [Calothrix sp. NIES-4105]